MDTQETIGGHRRRGAHRWLALWIAFSFSHCDCFRIDFSDGDGSSGCAQSRTSLIGRPCTTDQDCRTDLPSSGNPLTCADGVCMEPCESSVDCPRNARAVCRDGLCQFCLTHHECPDALGCNTGLCEELLCAFDGQCKPLTFCDGERCVRALEPIGAPCNRNEKCESRKCVDGTCCPAQCPLGCFGAECFEAHGAACETTACDSNPASEMRLHDLDTHANPVVAGTPSGAWILVWETVTASQHSLRARLFEPAAPTVTVEVESWSPALSALVEPQLAVAGDGSFLVTWRRDLADGFRYDVYARRFDAGATPLGPSFRVNATREEEQQRPVAAGDGVGSFVVAWESRDRDGDSWGIASRRIDDAGALAGLEHIVNGATMGSQQQPAIAMNDTGDAVVVWVDSPGLQPAGVVGRRLDPTGAPLGFDIPVSQGTVAWMAAPAVDVSATGNFVVTWASDGEDGDGSGIAYRPFAADGSATGVEEVANEFTQGLQVHSDITFLGNNDVWLTWIHLGQLGLKDGVFARRRVAADGSWTPEQQINRCACHDVGSAHVGAGPAGTIAIVWHGRVSEGLGLGLFGQWANPAGMLIGSP